MSNFTPDLHPPKELGAFRFWCQKVLPLTYDDSLSYYELLSKVVKILNDVISNQQTEGEDIAALHAAFGELEGYVNTYFNDLDIEGEVNARLDTYAEDGTLERLLGPVFDEYVETTNAAVEDLNNRVGAFGARVLHVEQDMNTLENTVASAISEVTVDSEVQAIRTADMGRTSIPGGNWGACVYPTAGDAVRGQIDKTLWLSSKTRIGGSGAEDLNDYTEPGNYYIFRNSDAANVSNMPPIPSYYTDHSCAIKILSYTAAIKDGDSTYEVNYTYPTQIVMAWDSSWAFARTQINPVSEQYPTGRWTAWRSLNWNTVSAQLEGGTHIGTGVIDLNNLLTVGTYFSQTAAEQARVANAPTPEPGILYVSSTTGIETPGYDDIFREQRFTAWNGGTFIRYHISANAWSNWEQISAGIPDDQKADDMTVEHRAGSQAAGYEWTHRYLADGTENPGFNVGFLADIHGITLTELDALLDMYIANPQIKAVINLGDSATTVGTDMDPVYIKHIYDRLFAAGKGYAGVLGNHDITGITGQQALNIYENGVDNEIILNQPNQEATTGFRCGYVYGVDSNGLVWADSSNAATVATLADRVYMIQYTVRAQPTYLPIYLACCYDIKYNVIADNEVSKRVCMHELDNSISIFAQVCDFLKDKRHSPWIFCAHEVHTLPGHYQKIDTNFNSIYCSDTSEGGSDKEFKPYNFYLNQFIQGGQVYTSTYENTTKYNAFTRLYLALEKGTATNTLTFSAGANGSIPARTFNWTVTPYSALNDVALYVCGHNHIDTGFAKEVGYDTLYPDISSTALSLTTQNTNPARDYSDIIFDRSNRYLQNTTTTIGVTNRPYTDGSLRGNVAFVVQRNGAQHTIGGIDRKKLVYSRRKGG